MLRLRFRAKSMDSMNMLLYLLSIIGQIHSVVRRSLRLPSSWNEFVLFLVLHKVLDHDVFVDDDDAP